MQQVAAWYRLQQYLSVQDPRGSGERLSPDLRSGERLGEVNDEKQHRTLGFV